jgi:hypothetical protein
MVASHPKPVHSARLKFLQMVKKNPGSFEKPGGLSSGITMHMMVAELKRSTGQGDFKLPSRTLSMGIGCFGDISCRDSFSMMAHFWQIASGRNRRRSSLPRGSYEVRCLPLVLFRGEPVLGRFCHYVFCSSSDNLPPKFTYAVLIFWNISE